MYPFAETERLRTETLAALSDGASFDLIVSQLML
jgi:hypothetical protein